MRPEPSLLKMETAGKKLLMQITLKSHQLPALLCTYPQKISIRALTKAPDDASSCRRSLMEEIASTATSSKRIAMNNLIVYLLFQSSPCVT